MHKWWEMPYLRANPSMNEGSIDTPGKTFFSSVNIAGLSHLEEEKPAILSKMTEGVTASI
jgi:hypothetical protein